MTLLAFLFAIGLLVTVHEWGHYRVAVACGVKVYTFSVGFGPTLLKWRAKQPHPHQNTEFQIGLLPLGGFVRMADEREGAVCEADLPMAFNRQPLWARASIVAAGPLANLLLAVVLFAAMNMVGRYQTAPVLAAPVADSQAHRAGLKSGDEILRVALDGEALEPVSSLEDLRAWIIEQTELPLLLEVKSQERAAIRLLRLDAPISVFEGVSDRWQARGFTGAWSRPVVAEVVPGEPAAEAGLQSGDVVLKVDGQRVDDALTLRRLIRASGVSASPATQLWEVQRGERLLDLSVTPNRAPDGAFYIGRVGARFGDAPSKVWIQLTPLNALTHALDQLFNHVKSAIAVIGRLVSGASWEQVGGPLMIADYAGRTAQMGLGVYLGYLAMLSVSLGVFNLLPLPALDGGYLLYYLYEFVTGKSPSDVWLGVLQKLGFALLLTLMIFSFLNDAVRMGWLGG